MVWDYPILKALSKRPLVRRFLESRGVKTQVFGAELLDLDEEFREKIEEKRREWEKHGINRKLQDYAIDLAKEWTLKMTEFHRRMLTGVLPDEEVNNIVKKLTKNLFKEALDTVAERWVVAMSK